MVISQKHVQWPTSDANITLNISLRLLLFLPVFIVVIKDAAAAADEDDDDGNHHHHRRRNDYHLFSHFRTNSSRSRIIMT